MKTKLEAISAFMNGARQYYIVQLVSVIEARCFEVDKRQTIDPPVAAYKIAGILGLKGSDIRSLIELMELRNVIVHSPLEVQVTDQDIARYSELVSRFAK